MQENEQENWFLLQQLQGLAEAFPRHLGPPWVLVERFTSQGGSNYGDLLERRLAALEAVHMQQGGTRKGEDPGFDRMAYDSVS